MSTASLKLAALTAAAIAMTSLAIAAETPKVTDLLFDKPQLDLAPEGSTISYRFERTNAMFKQDSYTDDIKVKVDKVAGDGKRHVLINIFTGERARDPQMVTDVTGNPVIVLYLDRAVRAFGDLAGGTPAYLKNRFKVELRDNSSVEAIKIDYNGQSVDAYKVTVVPYAKDPNKQKMQGYEGSKFALILSPSIPGHIYELRSTVESTLKGSPKIEETIKVVGLEVAK